VKTTANRARSGAKSFIMAIAQAQPRSGASLDSKCKMPATPPLPIVNQPEFPHGLLEFCTTLQDWQSARCHHILGNYTLNYHE